MPLGTQARLLRVLETGEYIRVGSSKVQKTDVRVIAATNKDLLNFMQSGKFREDLYYRLNTVPIRVPALRDRKEDTVLLFRKFVSDFAERYHKQPMQLDEAAKQLLMNYPFPGNVRELKNIAEQLSVLSPNNVVTAAELQTFLPEHRDNKLPVLSSQHSAGSNFANEREILYRLFFDMKKDVTELKKMFLELLKNPSITDSLNEYAKEKLNGTFNSQQEETVIQPYFDNVNLPAVTEQNRQPVILQPQNGAAIQPHEDVEESLNIMDKEKELIQKALQKHRKRRKDAALELGISERTLYRKLKEYRIEE
jgi:DNA-binding NtrC family response regulator